MRYKVALQIMAAVTVLVVLYIVFYVLKSNRKKHRIDPFALHLNHRDDSVEKEAITVINRISNFLAKLVIFNGIARSYDKYIYEEDKRFKTGMDFISLKISLGFIFMFIYLLNTYLFRLTPTTLLAIATFIMGFVIPDFYCVIKEKRYNLNINKDILSAIILMNNSLKKNKSIESSIKDVINTIDGPIKKEYKIILLDLKIGLSYGDAFYRMYKRTNNRDILAISRIFKVFNNSSNALDPLLELESRLIDKEKLTFKINRLKLFNRLILVIALLLPLIVCLFLIFTDKAVLDIILNNYGVLIVTIEIFIYLDYILILNLLVGGLKHE